MMMQSRELLSLFGDLRYDFATGKIKAFFKNYTLDTTTVAATS